MTEEEWIRATDARRLLSLSLGKVSPRKLRLFIVAWCRHNWTRITMPIVQEAVDLTERFADGRVAKKQLESLFEQGRSVMFTGVLPYLLWPDSSQMHDCAVGFCANDWSLWETFKDDGGAAYYASQTARTNLFRDIVGNPFRPVAFDPDWRTSTAVAIARGMYESRDFGAMPILADALQDAGCENEDVLNHCRDASQVHVRGCWVVDLVLDKQ